MKSRALLSVVASCLLQHASAQTEFTSLTTCFAPLTSSFLAGNGASSSSSVPELSEWVPSYEGSPAASIDLSNPHIAMADALGNVYIADKASHSILKVTTDGLIHTFAGTHTYPYTGPPPSYSPPAGFAQDGPAPATTLNLVACNGLYVLPNGVVYIYDAGNHRIRRVGLDGIMTTIVNDPDPYWLPSGRGLWVSQAEDLIYYTQEVADLSASIPSTSINHPALGGVVKKWTPAGGIQAITSYPVAPNTAGLELTNPGNIDVHPLTHKLYVCDRAEDNPARSCVYRIDAESPNPATQASSKTVVAGILGATSGPTTDGGLATATYLNQVRGIAFTPNGGYFVCTHKGGQVWYVDSDASNAHIHLFVHGRGKNDIAYFGATPLPLPVTTIECDSQPRAVTVTPNGSVLITSNDSGRVRKLSNICPPVPPNILSVGIDPSTDDYQFTWQSSPGQTYLIERSLSLQSASWQVREIITASNTSALFHEPIPFGQTRAFYRISSPR